MKSAKKLFKKMIQKPLRFHHQDIHQELETMLQVLKDIQSLQSALLYEIKELNRRQQDD